MKKILLLAIALILVIPSSIKGIDTSSECMVVMDMDSKQMLYSKNPHKPRLIASITKIMTAIIAIESNKLDDIVIVDDIIKEAIGSNIYIEIGEELTIRDLLYALMLRSGNDAALVISKYIGTSVDSFVEMMNKKAEQLGMNNTIFSNPHGLDNVNKNLSTAYDMALLSSYASSNIEYMKIVGTTKYTTKSNYKSYVWYNKNKLLKNKYITGGKTGFTKLARRTLVSTGSKNNVNITIVTLNDNNDFKNHTMMYDYVFDKYSNYQLLDKDNFIVKNDTYYKDKLYINNDVYYSLTKDELKNIKSIIKLEKLTNYQDNDKVGVNNIYIGSKLIHSEDIFINIKKVEKLNFIDKIIRWFKGD